MSVSKIAQKAYNFLISRVRTLFFKLFISYNVCLFVLKRASKAFDFLQQHSYYLMNHRTSLFITYNTSTNHIVRLSQSW